MNKLLIILSILNFCPLNFAEEFTISIAHLNDFHARFQETNINSGRCPSSDRKKNKCYGGLPRISTKLKELREKDPETIFLAAGDYFQGTVWYTVHKWKPFASFLNMIGQDAMSLGNHEFDDGIKGLVPFLDNVTFPVLAANLDVTQEVSMKDKVKPYVILKRYGKKIGIIGYVTTDTKFISNPGMVKFKDEVESIKSFAKLLKSQGCDVIIALGHAGYKKDLEIARKVRGINIVVGGHTNTFLYNGTSPSAEEVIGEYPTVVEQEDGNSVLVVQAYAFGKYLGFLQATFNERGNIVSWNGNPILLDDSVAQDAQMLSKMEEWQNEIDEKVDEPIGRSYVFLNGSRMICRRFECNMGNLVADAMVHQNAKYPDDKKWAETALAVVNAGGIRSSIDETITNGSITLGDILTVLPFANTIDIVELMGKDIRSMFEFSVHNYETNGIDGFGGFLQVSGFKITYDLSKPSGHRVTKITARCIECRVPQYELLDDGLIYKVSMSSFIANGGDGYTVLKKNKINHHLTGLIDSDVLLEYIKMYSPIYEGIENRIEFQVENSGKDSSSTAAASHSACDHLNIIIAILAVIIASLIIMLLTLMYNVFKKRRFGRITDSQEITLKT